MKAVIGFLENIGFGEGAKEIAEKHQVDSRIIRGWMNDQFKDIFLSRRIPYVGPTADIRCPPGSYFFKLGVRVEPKVLKRFVLRKMGLRESLTIKSNAIKGYQMPVGLLVKRYANDENPGKLSFIDENNVWDLASNVNAFYSQRNDRTTPYFIEADRKFFNKYSVDKFLS